jgi:hypothetical protein
MMFKAFFSCNIAIGFRILLAGVKDAITAIIGLLFIIKRINNLADQLINMITVRFGPLPVGISI